MEDKKLTNSTQNFNIDHEQLKIVADVIKTCTIELANAKQKADNAWNECRVSLGENITQSIDERKASTDKKYKKAIEEVDNSANTLLTVSNIWENTENQLLSSSKEFEEIVNKINNNLIQLFGFKVFKVDNKQNDSSDI